MIGIIKYENRDLSNIMGITEILARRARQFQLKIAERAKRLDSNSVELKKESKEFKSKKSNAHLLYRV
jgi:hypothetical protein